MKSTVSSQPATRRADTAQPLAYCDTVACSFLVTLEDLPVPAASAMPARAAKEDDAVPASCRKARRP